MFSEGSSRPDGKHFIKGSPVRRRASSTQGDELTMSEEKAKKSSKTAKKKTTEKKASAKKTEELVVKDDSLDYIDYVGKTKDEGLIFDLTLESVAKEEGLYKEDNRYEPELVAIGWNWMLPAIEEGLVGMKVGESKTIKVPPEKAFGARDPQKVKSIAKAKLRKLGVRGYVGEEVTVGNERGVIRTILGRTIRVDFNSPLAGKDIVFDITVREIVSGVDAKLKAVIKRRIPPLPDDKFNVAVKGKVVTIDLPWESRYIENIQYAEIGIAMDALKVVEKAKEVKLVTTFERPAPREDNKT